MVTATLRDEATRAPVQGVTIDMHRTHVGLMWDQLLKAKGVTDKNGSVELQVKMTDYLQAWIVVDESQLRWYPRMQFGFDWQRGDSGWIVIDPDRHTGEGLAPIELRVVAKQPSR